MDHPSPATDIAARLEAELKAMKAFVALLETEQQALIDGNIEQLPSLSESKTQAVHELNELVRMRKNNLLAHSAAIDAQGVAAWLQAHAANCLPLWQEIQQLAGQLQDLNRSNGTLIQTRLRQTQQALSVLQGAASSVHGLYGADGQPHIPSSGRILGSV